jgi:hypothetical protein
VREKAEFRKSFGTAGDSQPSLHQSLRAPYKITDHLKLIHRFPERLTEILY